MNDENRESIKDSTPELDFEAALARLEKIVSQLDQGQLTLEESMACFEEGMKLIRLCGEKLQVAQSKIERLVKRADGSLGWTEMPEVPGDSEAPQP